MIQIKKYKKISVPCRDRDTKQMKTFIVYAVDFTDACRILQFELDNNWQIGYGSM